MYFENGDEDAEALKKFILGKLESVCEADPHVLADYIVTLLKHDVKSESEMKQFCKSQLEDFLLDNTDSFIKLLFDTLKSKAYLRRGNFYTRNQEVRGRQTGRQTKRYNPMDSRSSNGNLRRAVPNLPIESLPAEVAGHVGENGTVYMASDSGRQQRSLAGGANRRRGRDTAHHAPAPPPHLARFNPKNTNTTLVMENIPDEHLNIQSVGDAFGKFGNVVNITLQPQSKRAIVHFSSSYEAHQAYTNPESYFGNRFVKVFWYKEDSAAAIEKAKQEQHAKALEEAKKRAVEIHQEQLVQLEEKKKQMQSVAEEEARKAQEQSELLARNQELAKNLMSRLEAGGSSMTSEERAELMKQLREANNAIQSILQQIKNTVKSLPSSNMLTPLSPPKAADGDTDMSDANSDSAPQFRYSAARGRGRGSRIRSAHPVPLAVSGSRSLDMRPKKLLIKLENTSPEQVNAIFGQFGSVEFVIPGGEANTYFVTYSARWEAEKAMNAISKANSSDEPGVVPKMEAVWVENNNQAI